MSKGKWMVENEQTGPMRSGAIAVAMALYLVLLGVATWRHTFWRDEAAAWLIGRDNSLWSMMHVVRYEGHPPLWFLVMWVISHLTWNPEWMKLPNLIATLATAGIIVAARGLSIWTRLGLIFSYFLLFEYGVIDRNYMIGIVFLVAAAMWMKRSGAEMKTAVALSLAALTSVPALIVAVCLYGYWLAGRAQERRSTRRGWALVLFVVSVACSVAVVWPPADSGSVLLIDHWSAWVRLTHALSSIAKAYLPIPGATIHFWNVTLWSLGPMWLEGVVGALLAIGLTVFFRNRLVRWFFVGSSILLLGQMTFTGLQFMRHVGWLFVVFLLALLLEGDRDLGKSWRGWMLTGILLVQAGSGVYAATVTLVVPFSSARQVAEFMREKRLDKAPLAFSPGVAGLAVLAYLERPSAYYPERHGQASYFIWNRDALWNEHMPTPEEIVELSSSGEPAVLVTETPLNMEQMTHLRVEEIGSFGGEIASAYPYFLYRRTPDAAQKTASDRMR